MEQYRGVRGQHWLARLLLPRPAMEHGMTIFPLHTHILTYRSGTVRKVGKHRHVSCEIRSVPPVTTERFPKISSEGLCVPGVFRPDDGVWLAEQVNLIYLLLEKELILTGGGTFAHS